MKSLLYMGLILPTLLFSCKKDDNGIGDNPCGEKFTVSITSADLLSCEYKTGTYWVFTDSTDNSTDSIAIRSFKQEFIKDACGNSYETHSFQAYSSKSAELTQYVIAAGGLFKDYDGTSNSGTLLYDDFNTATSKTNYLIEKFDSLYIFDRYYHKVLRIEIGDDPTENHNKSIYFMNSDFGFLGQDIYSGNFLISKKVLIRKQIVR
ncbi:MAG: hypothetical protein IPH88_02880 [Bacteroidales bacterium]|nr:hypothetical protein [Bacteroidales bacterium]